MKVYVAGPYATAAAVREIHSRLWALCLEPVSTWAEAAAGPESFAGMTPEDLARVAEKNDADLRSADVVLVVDIEGRGRETYAELRVALEWGMPAVFVGKLSLTSWRRGVVRAESLDEALARLADMHVAFVAGYRGFALATVAA